MDAQELILKAFDQRYQCYVAERKRCREDFSEEAVHDMRIASRRLLALVDLLQEVTPHLNLKNLRAVFKNQLDSLDNLRDTQVMLAEFTENIENLPELATLIKFLKKREKRLLEAAEHDVHEFKLTRIARQIENTRTNLASLNAEQELSPRLLPALDNARLKVNQRLQAVEIQARIDTAMTQLSPEHRAAILLREVEGLRYEEIAESTGCTVGTVMSRLFYARKKLQELLKDAYEHQS